LADSAARHARDKGPRPRGQGVPTLVRPMADGGLSRPIITRFDLCLVEAGARPMAKTGWIYELKYDGYRCLAKHVAGMSAMISLNGRNLSRAFPNLIGEIERLPDGTAIDGQLQSDSIAHASADHPATLVACDLLMYDGEDLRGLPLLKRKSLLKQALRKLKLIRCAHHVEDDYTGACSAAAERNIEHIIAKRSDSAYTAGRCADWVEIRAAGARRSSLPRSTVE
jgi:bifunctional non-homologous end joining protein LigD